LIEAITRRFAEVEAELRHELALDLAIDQLPTFAAGHDDAVAGGESLEEAATALGIHLRENDPIDANGRGVHRNAVATINAGI